MLFTRLLHSIKADGEYQLLKSVCLTLTQGMFSKFLIPCSPNDGGIQ